MIGSISPARYPGVCYIIMEARMQLDLASQKLHLLFISDLHMQLPQLQRLAHQVRAQKLHFDYCLVGGDMANCDHTNKTHDEQTTLEETQQLLTNIQDLFQCKVLFVPGNHDPLAYLAGMQHPCPDIVNIHKREFVLEVGLSIVGLGGSLPGYGDAEFKEQRWAGYPYQTEQDYQKDIQSVFKQDDLQTSKIYLVHNGPSHSTTTIDRSKQQFVYAGSRSLNSVLHHKNLLLLLHGHVHEGSRYDLYRKTPIVNPGALCLGDYAMLTLTRSQKVWKLSKISFDKLF